MRYPWWDRLADLRLRPHAGVTVDYLNDWFDCCAHFIEEHAAESEPFGWRPVHVMHPKTGLARRWCRIWPPSVAVNDAALFANFRDRPGPDTEVSGITFAYRPERDGSISVLIGRERQVALARL